MAKPQKEFLEGLSALADGLRRQIDANLDGWDMSPEAIAERRRNRVERGELVIYSWDHQAEPAGLF